MRHISEAEVDRLLVPRELTNILEQSFQDLAHKRASAQPRLRVVHDKFVLHNLPSIHPGLGFGAIKSYLTGPAGMASVTLLFDLETNQLVAAVDSMRLGQLRTGCATALAARHLAPRGELRLGLVGTGTVAEGQLEALDSEFGNRISEVRVFSPKAESRERFAAWALERLKLQVVGVETVEAATRGSNLIVTATAAQQPVVGPEHLGSSGLLCAVGSNWAKKSEVTPEAVMACREWWTDLNEQARIEAGDLLLCPLFDWSKLRSLADLVKATPERESEHAWVFFKSLGVGLEDLAAAALVYRKLQSESTT